MIFILIRANIKRYETIEKTDCRQDTSLVTQADVLQDPFNLATASAEIPNRISLFLQD